MARNTRQIILDTARTLYNEKGYGAVTNEMLAKTAGIAQGNLWYHFRTQRDILDELTQEFLLEIGERLDIRPVEGSDILDDYVSLLLRMGAEFRRNRFLYRDQTEIGAFSEPLQTSLPDLISRTIDQFMEFFREMIAQGHFITGEAQLRDFTTALVLMMRYNLEFYREMNISAPTSEGGVRFGYGLHLTVLNPYLTPGALDQLKAALIQ